MARSRREGRPVQSLARVREAARRAVLATVGERELTEADQVAAGVRAVAQEIAPLIKPGSLYWTAPFQYVVEQMAPRVCRTHGLALERQEDVAAYLLAGLNEYVVSLVGEFDVEHFEAWSAAAAQQEGASG